MTHNTLHVLYLLKFPVFFHMAIYIVETKKYHNFRFFQYCAALALKGIVRC